jgi:hypothetical protein
MPIRGAAEMQPAQLGDPEAPTLDLGAFNGTAVIKARSRSPGLDVSCA